MRGQSLIAFARPHFLTCVRLPDLYIDETLQTLQYASRVKSIKNRPNVSEADELRYLRAALTDLRAVKEALRASEPASPTEAAARTGPGAGSIAREEEFLRALAVADQERLVGRSPSPPFPLDFR